MITSILIIASKKTPKRLVGTDKGLDDGGWPGLPPTEISLET